MTPVALGSAAGLLIATQASRVLTSQLYGVSRLDPVALVLTAIVFGTAALLAAWIPARRAASVDPVRALRAE